MRAQRKPRTNACAGLNPRLRCFKNWAGQDALADAQKYDAEVIRDSWGVPHIFGARDADVAFGLGYTQSEDDLGTVQTVLAASRGHLSRYRGLDAAISDYLVTVLGVWDLVDNKYESDLAEPARMMAEAYAAGVNLYAAEHPEKALKGLFPMTGKDSPLDTAAEAKLCLRSCSRTSSRPASFRNFMQGRCNGMRLPPTPSMTFGPLRGIRCRTCRRRVRHCVGIWIWCRILGSSWRLWWNYHAPGCCCRYRRRGVPP